VARTEESRKVESVTDFLQRVLGIDEEWEDATDLWFRGQPEDRPLRPRLYRHPKRGWRRHRVLCRRPLRSRDTPQIGRDDRDVARVRGAHT
jgi:hypothetical protein